MQATLINNQTSYMLNGERANFIKTYKDVPTIFCLFGKFKFFQL
jgi:hypothetical protein